MDFVWNLGLESQLKVQAFGFRLQRGELGTQCAPGSEGVSWGQGLILPGGIQANSWQIGMMELLGSIASPIPFPLAG